MENSTDPPYDIRSIPGDEVSFEVFYKRLYPRLCSMAYLFLKSRTSAEDVVQEVFASVWRRRDEIRITGSLEGYMVRTVYHLCMRELNRNSRSQFLDDIPFGDVPELSDIPVEGLSDEEQKKMNRLHEAISALPKQCGRIFLMCKKDGLRQKEIAGMLGISVKTVNNQVLKAMIRLRVQLARDDADMKKNTWP